MRIHVFVLLLVFQLARGTLNNPTVVNYFSVGVNESVQGVIARMVVDDTATCLFSLLYDDQYNHTLLIIPLNPQYGLLDETRVSTIPLGIKKFNAFFYDIESPMPGRVAVTITTQSCDSDSDTTTFTLFNSKGELEQTIYTDGYRFMVKPIQSPDSPFFNSLFLPSYCRPNVVVLTWTGSQYESQIHSYLNFTSHAIAGNYIYGVTYDNLEYLCQYELSQVLLGSAANSSCYNAPVLIDDDDDIAVLVSAAQNRLAWLIDAQDLDTGNFIFIYDIPQFEEIGQVPLPPQDQDANFELVQISKFGDLLFGTLGDGNAIGWPVYRFQDISEVSVSQALFLEIYPSFLTLTPWGSFSLQLSGAVSTSSASYTYTTYFLPEVHGIYIVGYETIPIVDPNVVTTLSDKYIDVVGDTYRGVLWAIYSNESSTQLQAIQVDSSFTNLNIIGRYDPTYGHDFFKRSYFCDSMHLVVVGDLGTSIYDLSQWPEHMIQIALFPVPAYYDNGQQIIWLNGSPSIVVVTFVMNDEYAVCLNSNPYTTPKNCISIWFFPINAAGEVIELAMTSLGESEIIFISCTNASSLVHPSISLYTIPIESNHTLGALTTTKIMDDCLFTASKVLFGTEIWFACATLDTQYVIFQFNVETSTMGCILPTRVYYPNYFDFILRDDGNFLNVLTPIQILQYDISSCHQNGTENSFPLLRASYTPQNTYSQTALFRANGIDFQAGIGITGIDLIVDCDTGMRPNNDGYCSKCPPGTSGVLCQNCSGGFICEDYGTSIPNHACPPGYYCPPGTSTTNSSVAGGPSLCPAGTYCPFGIALEDVDLNAINSPRWCPQGYYCPVGSSKPDNFTCSKYSNTKGVGASSIADCVCVEGYWGYAGNCMQCPTGCDCHENVTVGCYVDITNDKHTMTICPPYAINGSTACNPLKLAWNGTGDFPCADGFSGRLCSKCLLDHYKQGRKCAMCHPDFQWKLPLAYAAIVLAAVIYVWFKRSGSSAVVLILAFHFQTLYALITGGNQWHIFSATVFNWASSASSFSLKAIECIFPWWDVGFKLVYYLSLPVLYMFFAGCAALVSIVYNKYFSAEPRPTMYYKLKAAKMVVYLFNFNYFSVMMAIFGVLATEDDYLNVYPWMKFNTTLAVIALIGLAMEGIIVPLGISITIWKHHHKLAEEGWVKRVFGGLYCVYVPSKYYWELVITARRFAIACIITFSPYNSPLLMIGMMAIVLLYMLIQDNVKPYFRTMDNILEIASHFILACTLAISLMVGYPRMHDYAEGLVYAAAAMNSLFLLVGVLYAVYSFKDRIVAILTIIKKVFSKAFGKRKAEQAQETQPLLVN